MSDKLYKECIEKLGWMMYGGDEALFAALKGFCDNLKHNSLSTYHDDYSYDYKEISTKIGLSTTWLLIYKFIELEWINYGCSPRYAWIEIGTYGAKLATYIREHSLEQLIEVAYGK